MKFSCLGRYLADSKGRDVLSAYFLQHFPNCTPKSSCVFEREIDREDAYCHLLFYLLQNLLLLPSPSQTNSHSHILKQGPTWTFRDRIFSSFDKEKAVQWSAIPYHFLYKTYVFNSFIILSPSSHFIFFEIVCINVHLVMY